MRAFTKLNWGNKVGVSIYNTCTSVTNRNHRLLCACSMCSIAFDRKKGDVNVWRHVKTCEDMRWRVKVVNANKFHWSLLHMNEEPDPSLTCLWSFGPFANSPHVFLLLRVLLMRWDGFKYFWLACRSQIRQRISLSGNRKGLLWLAIWEPLMNKGAFHKYSFQNYNRENNIKKKWD